MKELSYHDQLKELEEITLHPFSVLLLRDYLLPELLGKEHHSILYWAGKQLARKIQLSTLEELISFFHQPDGAIFILFARKKRNGI